MQMVFPDTTEQICTNIAEIIPNNMSLINLKEGEFCILLNHEIFKSRTWNIGCGPFS